MHGQVLPQAWREIEIRSQNEWKLSVSREKTHVLHQIGVDVAAETNGVLEISCHQNLHAHEKTNVCGPVRVLPHLCHCLQC